MRWKRPRSNNGKSTYIQDEKAGVTAPAFFVMLLAAVTALLFALGFKVNGYHCTIW